MNYKIDEIEGIGPAFAEKLSVANIKTTEDLLDHCCTPKGRKTTCETTGISEKQLLNWANMADLMRIKGVGKQFAEVLEAAGVDTVKELRNRNAENLAAAMKTINDEKKLAKSNPAVDLVQEWVNQAKTMDPKISY